jgi:hypothetical protein
VAHFSVDTHPGTMPIRVLRYNITANFKNVRDSTIAEHLNRIATGKANADIEYHVDTDKIKTPYLNCKDRVIVLQEAYLSFLWALTYFFLVVQEEGLQKQVKNNYFAGNILFNTPVLIGALNLFNWALTLRQSYSIWNSDLPNPENPNNAEEAYYAPKVNGIFIDAINYIIFHEYSHLLNKHCETIKGIKTRSSGCLSQDERFLLIEMEKEADLLAKEVIIKSNDPERDKLHKGLAIVICQCANLFLVGNPHGIKGFTHPDMDTRIDNALQSINVLDRPSKDYLFSLCCVAFKVFFDVHKVQSNGDPADTIEDLFTRYLDTFDKIKYVITS